MVLLFAIPTNTLITERIERIETLESIGANNVTEIEGTAVLEQDGCYITPDGTQIYLFPREIEGIEDPNELAIAEYAWYHNPQAQDQYDDETEEIVIDHETLAHTENLIINSGKTVVLAPRDQIVSDIQAVINKYPNQDTDKSIVWDLAAYIEWQWYLNQ